LAASARSGPAGPAGPPIVDADALADRVYRRMVQELIVERERAAGVG
jgi:hypothetical protein